MVRRSRSSYTGIPSFDRTTRTIVCDQSTRACVIKGSDRVEKGREMNRVLLSFGCLCVALFFSVNAKAQGSVRYQFLEVVDSEGHPVAGATVKAFGDTLATDSSGVLQKFPVAIGDYQTRS